MSENIKFTLNEVINNSVEKYNERIALSGIGKNEITYKLLGEKVTNITNFLKENGIVKGDKVAILSENSPNWVISYLAITTMGAVAVPIMTEFHESEVHHCLRHSESKAIFVSAKYYEKISDSKFEDITTVILLDDFSIIPKNTKSDLIKEVLETGEKEFAKIKAAALKFVGLINDEIKEDDLAAILYTSGTTGHSKGVMLTHKNITFDAYATTKLVEIDKNDKMLSILPLFHTIESTLGMVTPLMVGASVYYIDKPPTASVLLPALKKVKPTAIVSVPLIIEKNLLSKSITRDKQKSISKKIIQGSFFKKKINKAAGKKLYETFGGNLRMFCIGGAALSEDVELFLRESGFPYALGYGLTETAPLVTGTGPFITRLRSCGVPLYGMEIKIDEPDSDNSEGEVLIKGPNVMLGYYKDPENTKKVFTDDGWFRSGDLGLIEDGYLYIKGRSKNVIIGANGKNIYPEEIESVLNSFDGVIESLVFEQDKKLVARVHLDYEYLEEQYEMQKIQEPEARKKINELISQIMADLNNRLSTFSRINKIIEQPDPFEKTATKKLNDIYTFRK